MTPKRRIKEAVARITRNIGASIERRDKYSMGLAWEGYEGGYLAALQDVLLVLDHCDPCVRPNFWRD